MDGRPSSSLQAGAQLSIMRWGGVASGAVSHQLVHEPTQPCRRGGPDGMMQPGKRDRRGCCAQITAAISLKVSVKMETTPWHCQVICLALFTQVHPCST